MKEAEIVNRLFPAENNVQLTPDQLFDRQETPAAGFEAFVQKITELADSARDPQEKI